MVYENYYLFRPNYKRCRYCGFKPTSKPESKYCSKCGKPYKDVYSKQEAETMPKRFEIKRLW